MHLSAGGGDPELALVSMKNEPDSLALMVSGVNIKLAWMKGPDDALLMDALAATSSLLSVADRFAQFTAFLHTYADLNLL